MKRYLDLSKSFNSDRYWAKKCQKVHYLRQTMDSDQKMAKSIQKFGKKAHF